MPRPYRDRIAEYCEQRGIEVPSAFFRRSASRYAVVRTDKAPPRLVAATWFNRADVVYFLKGALTDELGVAPEDLPVRILDFKDEIELDYAGGERLKQGAKLSLAP